MNFYPRPPGGGRPDDFIAWATLAHISIHALRVEGDITVLEETAEEAISIHALRVEGDAISKGFILLSGFLSTPSGWRATCTAELLSAIFKFLSTPSGWRATAKTDKVFVCFCAKGRRICLFKTRKEKNLPVAF